MRERVTLVDGDGVGDTVARVEDDTGGTSGSVQREDGLDGDVEGGRVEGLEHDLGHLLAVDLGVERRLGEEDRVLFRGNTELVVELEIGKGQDEFSSSSRLEANSRYGARSSPCRPSW